MLFQTVELTIVAGLLSSCLIVVWYHYSTFYTAFFCYSSIFVASRGRQSELGQIRIRTAFHETRGNELTKRRGFNLFTIFFKISLFTLVISIVFHDEIYIIQTENTVIYQCRGKNWADCKTNVIS